jgi:predicted CXXCH cytochrome family protein
MRARSALAVVVVLAAPLAARATDAPHDRSSPLSASGCEGCHQLHGSPGGKLTRESQNSALCHSCHDKATPAFGFPWGTADQGTPGTSGRSHRWSGSAASALHGAAAPDPASADPTEAALGKALDGGNLQCSTCHDVHQADVFAGKLHTSVPPGTPVAHAVGIATVMQLDPVPVGARAAGYEIQVSGPNRFKISHDDGASYLGWNGSSWDLDTVAGFESGKPFTPGASVALDDGLTSVTFGGTITPGDVFVGFYVSYPFLRTADAGDRMCLACHKARDMRWQDAEGGDANGHVGGAKDVVLGTTVFSHPVGQPLDANGKGRDRTASSILDADGGPQSAGDGDPSNDLDLPGGNVTCTSCHAVHNADSNASTPDR